LSEQISGKEALLLLKINTRQGLHKIVRNHKLTVIGQGVGMPNLYLKSEIEKYITDNAKNIKKTNIKVIKKAEKIIKQIKVQKEKVKKLKVDTKKELKIKEPKPKPPVEEIELDPKEEIKLPYLSYEGFKMEDVLNSVGLDEFQRITQILQANGTYQEQDRALVLSYAISYQKYIFATAASGLEDDTITDQFGVLKLHPYFVVAKDCLSQMTKIASILGIGVRSRIGIEVKQERKASIMDILSQKEEF